MPKSVSKAGNVPEKDGKEGELDQLNETESSEGEQTLNVGKQPSGRKPGLHVAEEPMGSTAEDSPRSEDGRELPADDALSTEEADTDDGSARDGKDPGVDTTVSRLGTEAERSQCETGLGQYSISLLPLALLLMGASPVEVKATLPSCLRFLYEGVLPLSNPSEASRPSFFQTSSRKCRRQNDAEEGGATPNHFQTAHNLSADFQAAKTGSLPHSAAPEGEKGSSHESRQRKLQEEPRRAKRHKAAKGPARPSPERKQQTDSGDLQAVEGEPCGRRGEGILSPTGGGNDNGEADDRRESDRLGQNSPRDDFEDGQQAGRGRAYLEDELAILAAEWGRLVGVASVKVAAATVARTGGGPGRWTSSSVGDEETDGESCPFSTADQRDACILRELCWWLLCMARHAALRAKET